jgi:hypothetical protein
MSLGRSNTLEALAVALFSFAVTAAYRVAAGDRVCCATLLEAALKVELWLVITTAIFVS